MLEIVKVSNKIIKSKRVFNSLEWKTLIYLSNLQQIKELENKNQKDLFNDIYLTFRTNDIYKLFNTNYNNFNKTLRKLRQEPIIIEKDNKNIEVGFISKRTFFKNGICEVKIDKDIFEFFVYIKNNYSSIHNKTFYSLNYKHSFKLYSILTNVINQEYKRIKYTLEQLNKIFGTKYKSYNEINNNILKRSIEEINNSLIQNNQSFKVNYEPHYQNSNKYNLVIFDIL